jgi:hypothetical protein
MNSRRPRQVPVREAPVTDQLARIRDKFRRLRELDTQIGAVHALYEERSRLQEELLPAFMTVTPTQFVVNREITIGNEVYRLNPYWYDTRRNTIKAKVWKAAAFETFTVE